MDKLWEILDREQIKLRYKNIPLSGVLGLFLHEEEVGPLIILDNQLKYSERLHKCVLSHELGHFYTTPRTNVLTCHPSSNERAMESQDERKAMQWACNFLIPDKELEKALNAGHRSYFELAEYFRVTGWFVHRKFEILRSSRAM